MEGILMKKYYLVIMLIAIEILFWGCASTKSLVPFFEENHYNDHEGIVYVYRLKSMEGAIAPWNVRIDDKVVGVLYQGAYMPLHVSTGVHTIKITETSLGGFNLVIKGNDIFYIRCVGSDIRPVTKEEAMTELSSMKLDMGM